MTTARVPQFAALAVVDKASPGKVSQLGALGVVDDTPISRYARAAQFGALVVVQDVSRLGRVSQLAGLAVTNDTVIENFKQRAWTFTLDGHEFYVLTLGEFGTWVWDATTQTWSEWQTQGYPGWNFEGGIVWYDEVVIGHDIQNPIVWKLTPDSSIDETFREQERVVTGLVDVRGISSGMSVGALRLTASVGDVQSQRPATVSVRYSDDNGKSWRGPYSIVLDSDDDNQRLAWRSLGTIKAPGRVFEIKDFGGMIRIDDALIDIDGEDM